MAIKKKQTKAQARRKKLLQEKMKGIKKARKPVDKMIPRLKAGELAVKGALLLGPGGAAAKAATKLGKAAIRKAVKGATKKKALKRLPGEATRKRSLDQLRQPYRK